MKNQLTNLQLVVFIIISGKKKRAQKIKYNKETQFMKEKFHEKYCSSSNKKIFKKLINR